ncbi:MULTISPECIES: TetR/AcrR family transcriptional regulator [unclassified Acinetobacter]|uniref:TetR/AcrR family transcriptional regulator n=1 Tax=unclassified Acinetobacter TaxID=196816 RepID=UPI000A34577F|nr:MULTISPECIES: TetR/AcrR family transcriptional regulator [unclassified Acinetobacter]OTG57212.1 TetR family transcriptional regulator [Acinetobacter sp. ANC 4204]RGD92746.1 TetR/AcrR family transcriptional regulator [Acinetobacter sp. SWAC57]
MQASAGRPKDLEKRQRILNVARQLFLQHGYHGSSMDQIAKEAHVTKLTVYNHFQDKANLFSCAIEETCEKLMLGRSFQLQCAEDFQPMLKQICTLSMYIINLPEAIKLEHLLLQLAAEQNPLLHNFYKASHLKMQTIWEQFFHQAQTLGVLQFEQVNDAITLLMSLLFGYRHQEMLLGMNEVPSAEQCEQIIQEAISIFLFRYPIQKHEKQIE